MLCEIMIENVAVIEKATAVFGEEFTVLTGETGAGKSILIDSINAILGNRTSKDVVRSGADKAKIWATFRELSPQIVQSVQQAGFPCESELLLYREITADGKSSCRINGAPATAALLRDVCDGLINIHGQHDNQSLLNPARHVEVLDSFAQNAEEKADYATAFADWARLQKAITALSSDEDEKNRRMDLLRHETEEIEKAELVEGEEEELSEKRLIIRNSQSIVQSLNTAYQSLAGDDDAEIVGAVSLLGTAASEMTNAAQYALDLKPHADTLNELYYTAKETASELQDHLGRYDFDVNTLDEIEQRLDLLFKIKQKYGGSIQAAVAYGETAWEELVNIEFASERLEKLQKEEPAVKTRLQQTADALTETRKTTFGALNEQIAKALDFLNMPGIVMALQHKIVAFGSKGQDDVEFYISTNPGETPKPLAKIASGGELSRIMLALKSALANRDSVPTVIYDEIDTGISGLAAGRIGQLLQATATGRQVICVTHTAQVAAYASQHLLIEKTVQEGRTFTQMRLLDQNDRIQELARIISGDNVTDIAKANAFEMLHNAGNA